MNKIITIAISFTAGAITGGLVTGYFLKTRYQKEAQDEIADARQHYAKKMARLQDAAREDNKTPETKVEEEAPKTERHEPVKIEPTDYTSFAVHTDKPPLEDLVKGIEKMPDTPKDIYPITMEEYNVDREHEAIGWKYFEGDNTFLDENDEVVGNPAEALGEYADEMVYFDKIARNVGEDPDDRCIHIRNDRLMIDYEIDVVDDDWYKKEE